MKLIYWLLCLIPLGLFSGCASKVITYNATGQIIGSCTAQTGIFFTGKAKCYGYSSTENLYFSPPQKISAFSLPSVPVQTTLVQTDTQAQNQAQKTTTTSHSLPDLPQSSQISLTTTKPVLLDLPPQHKVRLFNETPTLD